MRPAKPAERIDVLFGVETLGGPRNIVLDGDIQPLWEGGGGVGECADRTVSKYNC